MHKTNETRFFALFALFLIVGFSVLAVWPDDADARRFGGGSSFGSRGSRSFSTPTRATTPRQSTVNRNSRTTQPTNSSTAGRSGGMSSGLMGGIGGFMLGGLLGSMLFGGGGGAGTAGGGGMGGGIGFLEILLIGGAIWFLLRWAKQQKAKAAGAGNAMPRQSLGDMFNTQSTNKPSPQTFSNQGGGDEISNGINQIVSMDANFDEHQFLEGAKMAFQQIQESWSNWSVDRLKPLLTERMWNMVQSQAQEAKAAGRRDIIEKIRFNKAEISEVWQESGEDWISVHLQITMLEYSTDVAGNLLEGDPDNPVAIEEYWTFSRPMGSQNPNWFLAAIQQPGEVARSAL